MKIVIKAVLTGFAAAALMVSSGSASSAMPSPGWWCGGLTTLVDGTC